MKFIFQSLAAQGALFLASVIIGLLLMANSIGRTGQTSRTSTGCGNQPGLQCHGTAANTGVRLTLLQGATPQTTKPVGTEIRVQPGSTTAFTLLVAHSNPGAGVDIAVKDSENGEESVGTLLAAEDGDVRYRPFATDGELSHTQPKRKATSDTAITFKFAWKAPDNQTGTHYLRAIANAVNLNGLNDTRDAWNWLTPVRIIVEKTTSVQSMPIDALAVAAYPNPCTDDVTLSWIAAQAGKYEVRIVDISGNVVFQTQGFMQPGKNFLRWNAAQTGVPSGLYTAVVQVGSIQTSAHITVIR